KNVSKHPPCRMHGEIPIPACRPVLIVRLADPRKRCEDDASRLQDAMQRRDGQVYLVNQLKGLGEYDAVEGIRRNLRSGGQVSDDSCLRITLGYIKHVAMLHP